MEQMQNSSRMAVGLMLPPGPVTARLRRVVQRARLIGFDSMWLYDHVQEFWPRNVWDRGFSWLATEERSPHEVLEYQTALGAMASHAGRAHLGVCVTESIRRHPVLIAQAAATLAQLSRRAPLIGLGSGERMNTEPYGLARTAAVTRVEEAAQILHRCWDHPGEPITFDGRHFHLDQAVMALPSPPGRKPQLWFAAHGPRMLKLTGRYGDGWLPHMVPPAVYAEMLAGIRTAAVTAGRDPARVTPGFVAYIGLARSRQDVHRLLRSRLLRYTTLLLPASVWQAVGAEHPLGLSVGYADVMPDRIDPARLEEILRQVPEEVMTSGLFLGTVTDVLDRLTEYADRGMQHVILSPASALVSKGDWYYVNWALLRLLRGCRGMHLSPPPPAPARTPQLTPSG